MDAYHPPAEQSIPAADQHRLWDSARSRQLIVAVAFFQYPLLVASVPYINYVVMWAYIGQPPQPFLHDPSDGPTWLVTFVRSTTILLISAPLVAGAQLLILMFVRFRLLTRVVFVALYIAQCLLAWCIVQATNPATLWFFAD